MLPFTNKYLVYLYWHYSTTQKPNPQNKNTKWVIYKKVRQVNRVFLVMNINSIEVCNILKISEHISSCWCWGWMLPRVHGHETHKKNIQKKFRLWTFQNVQEHCLTPSELWDRALRSWTNFGCFLKRSRKSWQDSGIRVSELQILTHRKDQVILSNTIQIACW